MKPTAIVTDICHGSWFVTARRRIRPGRCKAVQHWCRCECGTERWVNAADIAAGRSTNCGCVRRGKVAARNTTHGQTATREYVNWCGMIARCTNANHRAYSRYGGRGITVCDRWRESFAAFMEDMGPPPTAKHTIDRIDNDGPYEPANCRWVTNRENCRNQRKTVRLTLAGVTRSLPEWAERTGLPYATLAQRHRRGWDDAAALTTPLHGQPPAPPIA
jgi:hypothetical protein